ncbi:unnamed protein product [Malus baccata var. baccata]
MATFPSSSPADLHSCLITLRVKKRESLKKLKLMSCGSTRSWRNKKNANSEHPIAKSVVEHAMRLLKTFGSTEHVMEAKDFEVHKVPLK